MQFEAVACRLFLHYSYTLAQKASNYGIFCFDYIDIVIAPILVGGKDTSTLIDGRSLLSESELSQLGVLKLQECMVLENSYLRLRYQVIH